MKMNRRYLMGFSAVVLVGMVLGASVPKAVHAAMATLVRDIDNPGRSPVVTVSCQTTSNNGAIGDAECEPAYMVPTGQRLVIEEIEAICSTPTGSNLSDGQLDIQEPTGLTSHFFGIINQGTNCPTGTTFITNQLVRRYADTGSTFIFHQNTNDPTGQTSCNFQLEGYLINYNK
jgi:hypothetical protein